MSKATLKEVRDKRPDLAEQEDVQALAEDVDKFHGLAVLAGSEGGKVLISSLKKDILSTVEKLAGAYKTSSHIELVSLCAELKSNINVLRVLTRSKKKKDELQVLLKDILDA